MKQKRTLNLQENYRFPVYNCNTNEVNCVFGFGLITVSPFFFHPLLRFSLKFVVFVSNSQTLIMFALLKYCIGDILNTVDAYKL